MSRNIKTGVSTRAVQRLQAQLTLGMYQVVHYRKELAERRTNDTTYYLLRDGRVLPFREWYQLNRPEYVVSGSRQGCLGHRDRHDSSFLSAI